MSANPDKTISEMSKEEFGSMVNTIMDEFRRKGLVKKTKYVRKKGPWK